MHKGLNLGRRHDFLATASSTFSSSRSLDEGQSKGPVYNSSPEFDASG